MHTIRRNLIAWVALFFSLTGTGLAASRYVITSTSQIKPSVRHALIATSQGEIGDLVGFAEKQIEINKTERERIEGLCESIHDVSGYASTNKLISEALFEIWDKGC
jgi:hypothetical protein